MKRLKKNMKHVSVSIHSKKERINCNNRINARLNVFECVCLSVNVCVDGFIRRRITTKAPSL